MVILKKLKKTYNLLFYQFFKNIFFLLYKFELKNILIKFLKMNPI